MKRGSFAAGFLTCLLLAGVTTTAYAAGIMAERSHHRVVVDGKEVQMEAYRIKGNNYVKLRDMGEAVGFEVYWDSANGCVQVESGKPYTGTTPQKAVSEADAADSSRYVPKVGDVIRCDDGTNYTITDVRRYDANMFASGPLPELPEPTCDWSLPPQPELPDAEVRHFTIGDSEYMFIRNLYETRRMLYTLYNAIGDNPETWQDGKPVLHPSGNPKVRINLTIADDTQAECFWPWCESEIVAPFNSSPCGTHSLEAWDVYKDGVFLQTEYLVHHTV